jgi:hypothetical protein
VAAEITCCGWSADSRKTCALQMEGCGVKVDLDAQCQSPVNVDGSSSYSVCGQFDKADPVSRGTRMEDIALCMIRTFSL